MYRVSAGKFAAASEMFHCVWKRGSRARLKTVFGKNDW